MNQIYFKTRYLFILLSLLCCSVGMAQESLPNKKTADPKTVQETLVTSQTKDQVSNKTNDPNFSNDPNNLITQKEENIEGKELSEKETEAVKPKASILVLFSLTL